MGKSKVTHDFSTVQGLAPYSHIVQGSIIFQNKTLKKKNNPKFDGLDIWSHQDQGIKQSFRFNGSVACH